jgi:hypothetical protein
MTARPGPERLATSFASDTHGLAWPTTEPRLVSGDQALLGRGVERVWD